MANPSDKDLVRRTLNGEPDAYHTLVERYTGLVYGAVLSIVHRPDPAEDLVQETFCRAYEQLPGLRQPERFAPWLGRIAQNLARRWVQRELHRKRVEEGAIAAPLPSPDERLADQERLGILQRALARLTPEHRRIVLLYHMEGCSFRQIARFLDTPVATVRWRLLQSQRKLRQDLRRHQPPYQAARQRLAKGLVAALTGSLLSARRSPAAPWWAPAALMPLLATWGRRTAVVALCGSVLLHIAGVGLSQWLPDEAPRQARWTYWQVHRGVQWNNAYAPGTVAPRMEYLPPLAGTPLQPDASGALMPGPIPPLDLPPSYEGLAFAQEPPKVFRRSMDIPADDLLDRLLELALEDSSRSEPYDLLRLSDLDRAAQYRAALLETDGQTPEGYVQFGYLLLSGAGTFSSSYSSQEGNAVADLARYMRDHTSIKARVADESSYQYLWQQGVDQYPIHFLLQNGGRPLASEWDIAELQAEDVKALGAYIDKGGFVFVEGSPRYLKAMVGYVRQALDGRGRLIDVPADHPIYRAYYGFDDGFPGEIGARDNPAGHLGHPWYYPAQYSLRPNAVYPMGLWGVELDGELAVVFSDSGILSNWEPDVLLEGDQPTTTRFKSGSLRAATNIVAYALQRRSSLVYRLQPLPGRVDRSGSRPSQEPLSRL